MKFKDPKDIIVLAISIGILLAIMILVVAEAHAIIEHEREADESIVTLIKMTLTGLTGIIAGYLGSRK